MTRSRLLLSLAALLALGGALRADDPALRIGLVDSAFADVSGAVAKIVSGRFSQVMKDLTGLDGKAFTAGDALAVGQALDKGNLQLGVFQGFEFAWAQKRYPNLRPLMIAVDKHPHLHACLIVPKSSPARTVADLKGKDFASPLGSKGHCGLFCERCCQGAGKCAARTFFARIKRPSFPEAALDQVCNLDADATVVDKVVWELYQRIKPGNAAHLRVIQESEIFPAGVVAYRADSLSEETLAAIRTGLINAPNNARARQLMQMIGVTSFEPVPDDYAQTLANTLTAYPIPTPNPTAPNIKK